ncbi:DUF1839 family protein [Undibacterium griseum]|uniref:DUF1839 family protein n=1 Tax=Undibacterium griseum TaxID=2762295 RepID=A0ABR6YP59_9BURK|nr:DUF1839 family protein [Undibacterium griseum]MBC3885702.1 DUF1839 family protein [Undibacterium griseum]
MSISALPHIDPGSYQPHALHASDSAWPETNCYIDVWIEVLHAQQLNPLACLPVVFANDFDGDQWTFYKPAHEDLFQLYGMDVQELNVWRGLLENASEQLRRGRLVLSETDSFYLPDTAGTDYRTNHVKTTIAMQEIDISAQRLGYFHNSRYHELAGEDFRAIFRCGQAHDPAFMPLFAEFVRLDRVRPSAERELAVISRTLLSKYVARRPAHNPVRAFAPVLLRETERLKAEGMPAYHAFAFATLRQLGAGYSLGASCLRWLEQHQQGNFSDAAMAFETISSLSKTLLLKLARTVMSKKTVDLTPLLQDMAEQWDRGMSQLVQALQKPHS